MEKRGSRARASVRARSIKEVRKEVDVIRKSPANFMPEYILFSMSNRELGSLRRRACQLSYRSWRSRGCGCVMRSSPNSQAQIERVSHIVGPTAFLQTAWPNTHWHRCSRPRRTSVCRERPKSLRSEDPDTAFATTGAPQCRAQRAFPCETMSALMCPGFRNR